MISCYLVGTTGLLVKCAEILREQGHTIEGIISPDNDVYPFAQKNLIPIYKNIKDATAVLKNSTFDYLFSIVNPFIIPKWVLRRPRELAINYHDSPLPKYAGVHATSWAILNQEKIHGITWHEMVQKVDAGKILKQVTFPVHENETALSLNLRCYENAVKAFQDMLDDIERDELSGIKQNLSDRTFFALHQKPFGGGVIDWHQDIAYIRKLERALFFGIYKNNFTRLKIILPGKIILYPQKIEIVSKKPGALQSKPGTVVSINEDSLSVSCKDGVIRVQELFITHDYQLSLSEVLRISGIEIGYILPVFSNKQLQYFTDFMQDASKDIAYWQSKLENTKRVNIPWPTRDNDGSIFKTTINLPQKRSRAEIITYILICLNKLAHTEAISFYYADEVTQKVVEESQGLACAKIYNVHFSARDSIRSLVCNVSNQLNYEKEYNKLLSVDAIYNASERPNIGIQIQYSEVGRQSRLDSMVGLNFIIGKNGNTIDCITAKNKEAEVLCSRLQEYFSILEQGNSETKFLGNITLNTENEVKALTTWNNTEGLYPQNKGIHQLFEEKAEKTPDKIAVSYSNQQLSYKELKSRANQLAHHLKGLGVGSDTRVAVAIERSLEMVVSLLAILKAGGVYVPLDSEYPEERLNYILEDTEAKVLLTTSEFARLFSHYKGDVICLDREREKISKKLVINLQHTSSPNDLVYIIYTSGTTGKPKGVGNTHQGLINRLLWTHDCYRITSHDSFLYSASVGFDIAVWEMLFPLTGGASLIIPLEQEKKDIHSLIKIIDRWKVTNIHFVPSYLSLFIDNIKGYEGQSLKQIITGGEVVLNELKLKCMRVLKNTALYLAYGPTEVAISVTHWDCRKGESINKTSIGTPIFNTQIHILDTNLNQAPIGAIGELFIGGVGLARGYLNRPGLTAEKFIANPFSNTSGERMYRTGDLGRYLPDGNIEFIGRVDHQVKIRGFRIELGEIESTISSVSGVKQVIVLAREDEPGQKRLVAYVAPNNKVLLDEEGDTNQQSFITNIRQECSRTLPDYMRPSQIILLAEIPLTPHGKIDRKTLPKPEGREGLETYQAPEGLIESSLALIWKELLHVERVGRNDNFFHLGGDSIVSIHMVSRARKMGIHFDVKQIFATPTIAGIAANRRSQDQAIIPQHMMTGNVPFLPVQEDFFAQELVNKNHYNQSMWFIPTFKLSHQDKEKLKNCLKSIYHYHDTLRLRYDLYRSSSNSNKVNGPTIPVVQYYHDGNPFFWEEIVIDTWHDDILFREGTKIQQGLDILNGPTSRVAWFESKDGYQGMLWVVHHLLIDGVSWRILLDDLNTLFGNAQLPDKTHSYQEFSNYLRHRDNFSEVINYYQNIRKMDYSNFKLENKNKEGEELVFQHINIALSKEDTLSFIQKSHTSYNTQANDLLITALLLAIGSYKGTYDLLLELEGHGREGELDLSRTLGWFTSMYPAYLKLSDPNDLSRCIKEVKEQLRAIPEKGIGYGICVSQNKLSPIKGDLIFNYLGQWDIGKEAHKYFTFGYNSKGREIDIHNTRQHALIIESGVQDGTLGFSFTYSNAYNKDTIVKIANAYKANLQAVIKHCTNISNYGYTPSDFELVKISQGDIDSLFNQRNIQDLYPIVPIQSGLLFQYQLNPNSDAYFVQGIFEIENTPNIQHLKDAWQIILERYECLRSSFAYKTLNSPVQIIHKSVDILWRELDVSHLTQEEQEKTLEDTILQERHEGFDIQSPPLLRFNLLRRGQNNYYLIWNQHHLLTDGWSMPIILSEVDKIYESLENNTPLSFKTRRPYKDYIAWLNKQDRSKSVAYWKKELTNATPTKIGTEIIDKANYIRELFALSESQTDALAQFSKEAGVTLNSVFQAIWSLILSQQTRQKDITFGVTVSGRSISLSGIEDMVGIFINTVPFKVEIRPYESLRHFLQRIQKVTMEHQDNSYLPLSEIQATTARDLFDSIFVFENYPLTESDTISTDNLGKKLHLKPIKLVEKIEYPIGIMVCPGKQIYIHLHYQDSFFTREKIDNIKQGIVNICKHLQTSNMAVGNILSISHDTSIKLLQWNNTKADYPEGKCIHELFEKQVKETPNNIAIVYEEQELTYQQLNERVNQLAHYLRNLGVRPETFVAISVESPLEMVVGLFGILKAGGVYIPLDISHPEKRLESMLEDMQASILLTQTNLIKKFNTYKGTVVLLDKEKDNLAHLSTLNPRSHVSTHNLAYIIFTSGSTGKPNGVMVGHKQLVNLITSLGDLTSLQQGDSFIQNVPFSFDPSLWSTLWPLTQGGYVLLLDHSKLRDSEYILKLISDHSVKVLNIGPTMFRALISREHIKDCKTINHIIGGGDEWKYKDLQDLNEKLPSCHFSNAYGPTETTIQVLTWTCKERLESLPSIPLGKPIANARIYILDTNLNQVPIGAIGEIFIGGVGLARGYLNKPGLTAEKFIANPFSHKPGERLYRTGDLARYLPDGNIEFLGRVDDQVKIRGFRIELGEIESTLSQYDDVKQAVVVAREDQPGDKKLIAYVVPQEKLLSSLEQESLLTSSSQQEFAVLHGESLPALTEALRNHLTRSLPDYMIPSFFVFLNKMPLIPNGKIDRKSLPAPDLSLRHVGEEYVAPTTQIEQELVKIWSEVLELDQAEIGIKNNFFDLGGNSILLIRLKAKLEKELNYLHNLNVSDLFKYSTISALVDHLLKKDSSREVSYHISTLNATENKYDQSIAVLELSGTYTGSDTLEDYWNNLVNSTECLEKWSNEECQKNGVPSHLLNNDNYIPIGGIVKNIDKFDPFFWNLSFNDASLMDPQIRIFLEHSWIALEKAGYITECTKRKVGVYAGASTNQYYETRILGNPKLKSQMMNWVAETMNGADFLATRVSYLLGLTGPSLNINTACSTSLVALVEACNHLLLGKCDLALAGGVTLPMPEYHGYNYQEGMILSKDGHCRVFDKDSSGTVEGAGVGVVVLKRLKDAIQDKDNILAVIKGYAVNNDGHRKVGYTAPSVIGQTECILQAQKMAGITSDTISYIECHGTGTSLGDPIEIAALNDAFKANSNHSDYQCVLGAVKANIGHAGSSAGIAGFIKVCKMLQDKVIPPQINFESPNPNCKLEETNFKILTTKEPWETSSNLPRRAGVSAFGIGGTNAHIILEEYCPDIVASERGMHCDYYLLPISAKSVTSYKSYAQALGDYLESHSDINLGDVVYTLQYRREHFGQRGTIVCKSKEEAIAQLKNLGAPFKSAQVSPEVIMMFPGQGSQYSQMAKSLYELEPIFRSCVDECCKIISGIMNVDFKTYLYPDLDSPSHPDLRATQWSQPALFTICYALAKLFGFYKITASAYIGHSIGEYVAATLSGVFTVEDALRVVLKRGELMQSMPKGSMLAISDAEEKVKPILPEVLEISVYNSPEYVVVSGEDEAIENFKTFLLEHNISCSKLHTSHAFHSKLMEPAVQEFEQLIKTVNLNKPNKRFISNVTGDFITDEQAISSKYWANHIREAVQFSQGVLRLNKSYPNAVCLEVGPGNSLSTFISQHKKEEGLSSYTVNSLPTAKEFQQNQADDGQYFYQAIGKLWGWGYVIDWLMLWKAGLDQCRVLPLPGYQFEKNRCWIDLPEQKRIAEETPDIFESVVKTQNVSNDDLREMKVLIEEDTTEFEDSIAHIFSQVLGNHSFSKYDNFFDLGGTSLSAINLVNNLNNGLGVNLSASAIFKNENIYKLAQHLLSSKRTYQVVIELNNIHRDKPNLFMVHPGLAGCEVYSSLAKNLEGPFSCYGIDSYNLYHSDKIENMSDLAKYYLLKVDEIMLKTHQSKYYFLGWSLGGLIALEMASILEKREISNVKVCLLDSILDDDHLLSLKSNEQTLRYLKDEYTKYAMMQGHNQSSANESASLIELAMNLGKQGISATLINTHVVLFKAMRQNPKVTSNIFNKIQQYIVTLKYNNIEKILKDKSKIQIIKVDNAHHDNILEQENLLVSFLMTQRVIGTTEKFEYQCANLHNSSRTSLSVFGPKK